MGSNERVRIGIIGCGNISPAYFKGCGIYPFLDIVACADMDVGRARERAAEFRVPQASSVDDLLANADVELVINLTVPQAHAAVNLRILEAGKHAYCEKPFALTREEGSRVLAVARERNLRVGCAPDTFLGAGAQTGRRLIDEGAIGEPLGVTLCMACRGHESWHPNPDFYYQKGGGPLLDMGPYYLTAVINMLGPIRRVSASTRISFPERIITSQPKHGTVMKVETPTHLCGTLDFASGPIGTVVMSFDVWRHRLPMIEVYGSEGSLALPDPNSFKGGTLLARRGADWETVTDQHSDAVMRGIGVADMARAIRAGRPHRVSGDLAFHVLDAMLAFEESSTREAHVSLASDVERPAALPPHLAVDRID